MFDLFTARPRLHSSIGRRTGKNLSSSSSSSSSFFLSFFLSFFFFFFFFLNIYADTAGTTKRFTTHTYMSVEKFNHERCFCFSAAHVPGIVIALESSVEVAAWSSVGSLPVD